MIVLKFGGTSVGTAPNIRNILDIVRRETERRPLVVVSALAGVTDMLVELSRSAPRGEAATEAIEARHRDMLRELELPVDLLDPLFLELGDLVRGIKLVGEASGNYDTDEIEVTTSSPMGESLVKARVGETIKVNLPRGTKRFEIIELL